MKRLVMIIMLGTCYLHGFSGVKDMSYENAPAKPARTTQVNAAMVKQQEIAPAKLARNQNQNVVDTSMPVEMNKVDQNNQVVENNLSVKERFPIPTRPIINSFADVTTTDNILELEDSLHEMFNQIDATTYANNKAEIDEYLKDFDELAHAFYSDTQVDNSQILSNLSDIQDNLSALLANPTQPMLVPAKPARTNKVSTSPARIKTWEELFKANRDKKAMAPTGESFTPFTDASSTQLLTPPAKPVRTNVQPTPPAKPARSGVRSTSSSPVTTADVPSDTPWFWQ